MSGFLGLTIILGGIGHWTAQAAATGTESIPQYCNWEVFNVTCDAGEIAVIEHAWYGRMTLGRCLTTDLYTGCGADVLPQMDTRCSGKQACHLPLPDLTLHHQIQNCPHDMMAYLEASYSCVKVGTLGPDQYCRDPDSIPILTNSSGLLSSTSAHRSGYGTIGCPWVIRVSKGQRIRVSVLDFGLAARYESETWSRLGPEESSEYCYVYAMIHEIAGGKDFTVCAGTDRESVVYESSSNEMEIMLLDDDMNANNFAIKYEAVGCADLVAPDHAYVTRDGSSATITCNESTQAWHLVCKETDWVGEYSECTNGAVTAPDVLPSYGLILAILIGVAIGIMVGFVLLAGVLWCRRRSSSRRNLHEHHMSDQGSIATLPMSTTPGTPSQCKIHRLKGEYGYTHVWEVQGGSPGATVTRSPDSAYQSYQSQRGGPPPNSGETLVCFHPTRDHDYESPKFETFGVGISRDGTFQHHNHRPLYHGCSGRQLCPQQLPTQQQPQQPPQHTSLIKPQCGDSLDNVGVHIEVGLDAGAGRCGGGQTTTGYSMAGSDVTKPASTADPVTTTAVTVTPATIVSSSHDSAVDPRGNHYT